MSQHSQASIEPLVDDHNPYDVYLGRGNAVARNSGNRIYRSTIKQYKARYFEAKGHQAKAQIAKIVVKSFIEMGGTFYYKRGAVWEKAPIQIVLKKVKQALREKGLKSTREQRPSRISSRGQISRRGTISRSFPAGSSSSSSLLIGAKSQVGEKVSITRLDGSVVDAVSVCSSFAPASLAPTSQQLSEDRYPIDSGHWRRLRFQSKNKYTSSMIDRLSVASFSTTLTAESFKSPSTMQSSGDIHAFRPMDLQSTHMTQTMAAGHKNPEMKRQQFIHCADFSKSVQNSKNQNKSITKSSLNHDTTGQGESSISILSKDSQQLEGITNRCCAKLSSDQANPMPRLPLLQKQFNLSIPLRKGENVQVDLSYLYAETKSLHGSNMNSSNIQNSLMQERMGSITPSGQENNIILEDAENMDDELSSDLSNMDLLEYIDGTNYPENEYMYDNVNLEDIFEEPSRAINSSKCLNDQKEQNSKTSIGDKFHSLAI